MSNTTVTIDDLGDILGRVTGAIEKNGGVCNIKDVVVMPKWGDNKWVWVLIYFQLMHTFQNVKN